VEAPAITDQDRKIVTAGGPVSHSRQVLKDELEAQRLHMCQPNTDVTVSAIYKCHCRRAARRPRARNVSTELLAAGSARVDARCSTERPSSSGCATRVSACRSLLFAGGLSKRPL